MSHQKPPSTLKHAFRNPPPTSGGAGRAQNAASDSGLSKLKSAKTGPAPSAGHSDLNRRKRLGRVPVGVPSLELSFLLLGVEKK